MQITPLRGDVKADVCIIGGGFLGLWTGLELKTRSPGLDVVILERDICGGGASGRNGGLCSPQWQELDELCAVYGEDAGLRYVQATSDVIAEIGAWCLKHDVDARVHNDGIAYFPTASRDRTRELVDAVARRGCGQHLYAWDREEAARQISSPRIATAAFSPDGATLQPAMLARGMRRVAAQLGVSIHEHSHVVRVDECRPALISTTAGSVRADQLVIAVGAWGAGWPGLRHSVANVADFVVATEPIPDRLEAIGWRSHVGFVGGREFIYYFRRTDDRRIVIGGGDSGVLYGGRIGPGATHNRRVAEVAARGLGWLFPELGDVRFTHAWGGPIEMSRAFAPFYFSRGSGNVHVGLGFSGHGIGPTCVGGRVLASLVLGSDDEWTSLPVVGPPLGKMPGEPLRFALASLVLRAMASADAAVEAGRRRPPVRAALASMPFVMRQRLRRR